MFKNILISGLLCTFLSAQTVSEEPVGFDTFLQKAIQNSPYLNSLALTIKQTKEKGSMLTRLENPSLEMEYANFSPDVGDNDNGYRIAFSQPIRFWSIADNKKRFAKDMLQNEIVNTSQKKALFTHDIAMNFTLYAQQKDFLELSKEELDIANTIYTISKARYESGTVSRGVLLQAKIDYESAKIANESLVLATNSFYYSLLKIAGINEEITLDSSYKFEIKNSTNTMNNPNIILLKSEKNMALSEATVNNNAIEYIDTFAEYESEPDQNIVRLGVNIPLAIFNTKQEEKRISSLEASKAQLLIDNEEQKLEIEKKRLNRERTSLHKLQVKNEKLLADELELLAMFQNGYKIANINLLQLQGVKNKLISTKKNLIEISTALNQNAITRNYIQGIYND